MITNRVCLGPALVSACVFLAGWLGVAEVVSAQQGRALGFTRVPLLLPGVPAAIFPADVTGDGRDDLAVVVVYNQWGSVTEFEEASFDGVEGLVEVMNVVPALIDRRELRIYPGLIGQPGYGPSLPALALDTSIHAFSTMKNISGEGETLIAVTDEGISMVQVDVVKGMSSLRPLVLQPTSLSGSGRFYSDFEFLHDLDSDGHPDALLPTEGGWVLLPGIENSFSKQGVRFLAKPILGEPETDVHQGPEVGQVQEDGRKDRQLDQKDESELQPQRPRLPEVRDLNGDALDDLVLLHNDSGGPESSGILYRNLGGLTFAEPVVLQVPADWEGKDSQDEFGEIVYVGQLANDLRAVAVARWELKRWQDPTMRQEIDSAKRPLFGYRLYELREDFSRGPEQLRFQTSGYSFGDTEADEDSEDGFEIRLPLGFQDLDGDQRLDLIAMELDFSILPLITRALVTRSLKLTLNFKVSCQRADGTFETITGMDLSGRFKINLRNDKVRHLSQFAGDFDGDGRADFVQLGAGRGVNVHYGQAGCHYSATADQVIELERKPKHLGLVRVLDINGDLRSDLYVVHPLEKPNKERSTPVRIDIYVSQPS